MKKILLILICGTIGLLRSNAQSGQLHSSAKEGSIIESLRIAYITKELNLTSNEAERFWPVYNSYIAEIKKAKRDNVQSPDPLILDEQVLNIKKRYKENFSKILGSNERTNKLFIAENEFGRMIRKEWQNRMQRHSRLKENTSGDKGGTQIAPPNGN